MSDIFISYKREEQSTARKLANALESEGWSVWWDPKLRAGERFNDVIERALKESKCVVVMWSKLSVESQYVKHEANYALRRNKLVPVMIEEVELPFRFEDLHTLTLLEWDGSKDYSEFRRLVEDIAAIAPPSTGQKTQQRAESDVAPGTMSRDKRKGGSTKLPGVDQPKGKGGSTRLPSVEQPKPRLEPGRVFRDKLKDGSEGPEMVVVPAGTFRMGDVKGVKNEYALPVHTVQIIRPFAIGRYEVTFEEYGRFASATGLELPDDEGWGRGQRPVISVSWNDAMEYARWLSAQTGKRYRLPTEAEWEYAARSAGKEERWAGTSREGELAEYAWYGDNSHDKTQPVGGKKPNGLGLYDMSGNVWEWVQDCEHKNYKGAPTDGSAWLEADGGNCGQRVLRGGSWFDLPESLRASDRDRLTAGTRDFYIGFRLAQDID